MIDRLLLSDKELSLGDGSFTLAEKMGSLLNQQYNTWDLVSKNYTELNTVKVKSFDFDDFEVKVQFNPSRFTSSSAKVDDASI